tara:strand:- start:421 stop:972 length:552 start_codon:yes stop_codon:yes gene_type:complete
MTRSDSERPLDLLRFARVVYAVPGIQTICLQLQDEHNADVVLLLACCWYGCYHGELSTTRLAQARGFSRPWRAQLVAPLRQARRWLKHHPADTAGIATAEQEALRQRIKTLELDAEFMQLRALAALLAGPMTTRDTHEADAAASIRLNLNRYFSDDLTDGPGTIAGPGDAEIAALVQASILCR